MLIDHYAGERLPRTLDMKLDACRRGDGSLQMPDGSGLMVNIGSVRPLDLDGIRSTTNLQFQGLTDIERKRINRRLNGNRLVKYDLIGVTIDLDPQLFTVVVDQTPLLPTSAAPVSLVPLFQDNPAHHSIGLALFSQSSLQYFADSQIASDTHSVVPELVTCWA